ncbi:unnamed protein product [Cyprideis torosa]|uniref:Uncharacterized protein n=1 Tax=Cyprideis torosa TaxID=163714 RepID=A0A7R8W1I1_9CRUS|nr:unnamed protein product [Cyprideis torosa]CAG0880919.1 unnamed protein product [Cyprideis torosa]
MLLPIFTLNLNHKVLPGKVTIGSYDGKHPCLTAATAGEKVFIHNPHGTLGRSVHRMSFSDTHQDIRLLNINQPITALKAGRLNPMSNCDVLIIGTPVNLLAYDVQNNKDVFYKEIPDGIKTLTLGLLGAIENPLAIIGGNCSLHGFDHQGHDPFWTVTGDDVSSLALLDFDGDGDSELIVGSEDFEIRVFKEDAILTEVSETESVTHLTSLGGPRFGYALANGTVGVYEKATRWWRIKSKNTIVAIHGYDIDGDGEVELVTGWSNGKIDARNVRTGEVVFKDHLPHSIAGIVEGDYRLDGKIQLIVVSVEGEVRGYLPAPSVGHNQSLLDVNVEQETIRELSQAKMQLEMELRNYETNARVSSAGKRGEPEPLESSQNIGMIPANTQLQTGIALTAGEEGDPPHVELALASTNGTIIRSVLVFGEGVFEGESLVVHPPEAEVRETVRVPLFPPKDVPIDLHVKALVGFLEGVHFHVFELTRQLPRFAMYAPLEVEPPVQPSGLVTFSVQERVQRLAVWFNQNFLLAADLEVENGQGISRSFLALRTSLPLTIEVTPNANITIRTDDMDLAGDLVTSLASFLNLAELQVSAEFPAEIDRVSSLFEKADELHAVRTRLTAEMADHSGLIKSLVVRAEDARIMGEYDVMKQRYLDLMGLNRELFTRAQIRYNNHTQLADTLKELNQLVQRAAKLRVGKYKTQVINSCRQAIKDNNVAGLIRAVTTGEL